ncbi:MAG: hypothetical protein HYY31_05225, partial [Chloroflexi bacterium]|nr:hypothetical protein [Chloroflexota bacterium]
MPGWFIRAVTFGLSPGIAVWVAGILGFLTALAFLVISAIVFGGLQIAAILGGLLSLFV